MAVMRTSLREPARARLERKTGFSHTLPSRWTEKRRHDKGSFRADTVPWTIGIDFVAIQMQTSYKLISTAWPEILGRHEKTPSSYPPPSPTVQSTPQARHYCRLGKLARWSVPRFPSTKSAFASPLPPLLLPPTTATATTTGLRVSVGALSPTDSLPVGGGGYGGRMLLPSAGLSLRRAARCRRQGWSAPDPYNGASQRRRRVQEEASGLAMACPAGVPIAGAVAVARRCHRPTRRGSAVAQEEALRIEYHQADSAISIGCSSASFHRPAFQPTPP
ncbi:hypothetical protein M409DRAFT_53928 [Zasmidium cellare ATCC 36951]|uniref:Uncharacterized protein n=1 Tax=Zasmidium cellare ATCC 36951 TaxID=1080233 RepID=A0A6A6CJA9_ZASCE|nr:uncharacterized protein M409DRAFT_53928 [Zasmidium cellare ATCC 36951]KAF2167324.1 hypothetical protein M409DRAFT_53928 [Zasmidium cellare ATCC 36951]